MNNELNNILKEISHLLPKQGPIGVFIHHNTLHAFENIKFEDALEKASGIYGSKAYLPETRYQNEYKKGRITDHDLTFAIKSKFDCSEDIANFPKEFLIKEILRTSPPIESFQEVKWLLREKKKFIEKPNISQEQALFWFNSVKYQQGLQALREINREAADSLDNLVIKSKEIKDSEELTRLAIWTHALLTTALNWERNVTTVNTYKRNEEEDNLIDPILIRFCEEYLDLGFSTELMPERKQGMLHSFIRLIENSNYSLPKWLDSLKKDLVIIKEQNLLLILSELGIKEEEYETFLLNECLTLKGWAGLIALAEENPSILNLSPEEISPKLSDYITIRLILKKYARSYLGIQKENNDNLDELENLNQLYCSAYHLLCLISDMHIDQICLTDFSYINKIITELKNLPKKNRKAIWHIAYEHNLYDRTSTAIVNHPKNKSDSTYDAQFIFCIDDREESIRRHLEAISDKYQTFGTAGFFGIDASYTSIGGSSAPYCPVIITPTHSVREIPKKGQEKKLSRYQLIQQNWFKFSGYVDRESGSFIHGWLLTITGFLSFVPMVLGVIAPKMISPILKKLGVEGATPSDLIELELNFDDKQSTNMPGYTLEEMADRVGSLLRSIGLNKNFAEIILIVGHGSSSRNNPLRSAYDCGACGGKPGKMNARAFAIMANKPEIKNLVKAKFDIIIPENTCFVGAFHNTCSEEIEYFDVDLIPDKFKFSFNKVKNSLITATKNNALERCRRFTHSNARNPETAAKEVAARSLMLAEPRPEYGHATNALCIIGDRNITKDLFLDRRAFLVSYNHKTDNEANILNGILKAVVPVCGGINLEYFFSAVDNEVYGAGTKLPHNIVSLLGIMNGTCSDLRTGLPLQMVEIHEPVRLFLVICCNENQLEKVIENDVMIKRIFSGEWIKVARYDVDSNQLFFRSGKGEYSLFESSLSQPQFIKSYPEWFLGRQDHLGFVSLDRNSL